MDKKIFIRSRHSRYRFIKSLRPQAVVLDIGAGNGLMQKKLKRYRPDIRFISVDKYDFSRNFPPDTFFQTDVTKETLPIDAKTVDAVFCCHVLEHMLGCEMLLSEIKRVLKPDGSIYIETPGTRSMYLPSMGFLHSQNDVINFFDDPSHVRPFTQQSLRRIGIALDCREIKTGFARNWLYCLFAPALLAYAICKRDRKTMAVTLWSITGWCVYLWGKNINKQ